MTGSEILLAVVAAVAILGFTASVIVFSIWGAPAMQLRIMQRRFPISVPGTGMRVSRIPVSTITADDIARAWVMFRARCVAKGYDGEALDAEFARDYIEFVLGVDGERYIVDGYGRKIAGDRRGDVCRIVVVDGDTWEKTAGFHEWGHGAHETVGRVDYEHRDAIMWFEIVGWCRQEFRK